jgi:hypothetical protein
VYHFFDNVHEKVMQKINVSRLHNDRRGVEFFGRVGRPLGEAEKTLYSGENSHEKALGFDGRSAGADCGGRLQ